MDTITQAPGHVRVVVASMTSRREKHVVTACGAAQTSRDVLRAEIDKRQAQGWPICAECLERVRQFAARSRARGRR